MDQIQRRDDPAPEVRLEAVASLRDRTGLLRLLTDADPYLQHAAVQRLAHVPDLLAGLDFGKLADGDHLVWRPVTGHRGGTLLGPKGSRPA